MDPDPVAAGTETLAPSFTLGQFSTGALFPASHPASTGMAAAAASAAIRRSRPGRAVMGRSSIGVLSL
jgi:hypothetical protein